MNKLLMSPRRPRSSLSIAMIGVALALPIYAQDTVEEVIVTARQRAESITDVPASIKAFSAQDIERAVRVGTLKLVNH